MRLNTLIKTAALGIAGAATAVALAANASAYREISVETVVSEAMAELHVEVG